MIRQTKRILLHLTIYAHISRESEFQKLKSVWHSVVPIYRYLRIPRQNHEFKAQSKPENWLESRLIRWYISEAMGPRCHVLVGRRSRFTMVVDRETSIAEKIWTVQGMAMTARKKAWGPKSKTGCLTCRYVILSWLVSLIYACIVLGGYCSIQVANSQ